MIKKVFKYLSSLRFTIQLICLLGAVFLLGLWIPQKRLVQALYIQWKEHNPGLVQVLDYLQLTSIHTSPFTLVLWLLFFVNLGLVMWQRIPLLKKRVEITPARITDPETAPGYIFKRSYEMPAELSGEAFVEELRTLGFAVVGGPDGFYGVKNRLSPIAFALFHLSFFLVLLGGMVGVYTSFYAVVDLAQGEVFQGELEH
jgi:cytochrome c biogenesis protein ResB